MKEVILNKGGLTSQAQEGYPISMPTEGQLNMSPAKSQSTNPEHAEAPRGQMQSVSPERQAMAKNSWERDNYRRRASGEEISVDELRTQQMAWERGGGIPSGAQDAIDKTGIQNPLIIAEIDRANTLISSGIPLLNALSESLGSMRNLANVDNSEKQKAIERIEAEIAVAVGAESNLIIARSENENNGSRAQEVNWINNAVEDLSSGITSPKLLGEIEAIRNSLAAGYPAEEILRGAIARIAVLDMGGSTDQERVDQQKQVLLQKATRLGRGVIDGIVKGNLSRRHEGMYGERKLTEAEKELIRTAKTPEELWKLEELFNRMFDAVDSRPQDDFDNGFSSIGTFESAEFMKTLNEARTENNRVKNFGRAKELTDLINKFSREKTARSIIHNAYFAVISGQNTEAVSNYMAQFLNGYADLAFRKSGVTQAMHYYEQALLMVREKNGGYLPSKEVIGELGENRPGEVNEIAEALLGRANEEGKLVVGEDGEPTLENGRIKQLEKWELDRALSFSRGMSVIMGRSIEIAATSILPGTESGSSTYIDLFAQKIIQEIYPFRHGGVKFQTSKDNKVTRVLAYLLDSKRTPWTAKEIQDFDRMPSTEQTKVLNDLMPEGQERFFSVLNPFGIGGWLSKTGWRIGGDQVYPGESAIKKMLMNAQDRDWIGTGVVLEKERGALEKLESSNSKDREDGEEAAGKIKAALEKTARITPLRFFLNMREFKEGVLRDIYEGAGEDFFDIADKKAIKAEIDRRVRERTLVEVKKTKEVGEWDPDKGVVIDVEKTIKTEKFSEDARNSIMFEEIMKHKKFKDALTELVILQENALLKKSETLVTQGSKLGRILHHKFLNEKYNDEADVVKGKNETYLKLFLRRLKHKSWKTPFIFGTEDIPYNKYVFEETGPRGGARRWADMAAAAKAGVAFSEFLNGIEAYTEPGQIVEALHKIYLPIKDYNLDYAEQFVQDLSEGVMKFYGKKWTHRLPLGIGTANAMLGGESSYAQIAFGRGKMAWDELQLNEFTRLLRDKGFIKVEQQAKLQGKAGGGKKEVAWGYARTVLPLIMAALAYYIVTKAAKEERT